MLRQCSLHLLYGLGIFDKPWPEMKKEIGFGQLPVLIVDTKTYIWQSGSIMRYTANLANTCPTNEEDRGIADAIFESSQELFQPLNATINFKVGENTSLSKKRFYLDLNQRHFISISI